MSDTAQLFILAGIWTLVAIFVASRIANWSARIVALVLLVGIPFWELPYGFVNFLNVCDEQATWRAFEPIPPQESICVEDIDAGLYATLTRVGFTRIEVTGGSDNVKRDQDSGRVFRTKRGDVKSKYCLQSEVGKKLPWGISRNDLLVVTSTDRRVVGRQCSVIWSGLWWQIAARPILGKGGMCFDDPLRGLQAVRNGTT